MSQPEPREIIVFDKDYEKEGYDFRPQPVSSNAPLEVEPDSVPKDLSVVESAPSSAELEGSIPTLEEQLPPMHPSLLPPPVPTVSVEKDNGPAKVNAPLKQTSLEVPKTG